MTDQFICFFNSGATGYEEDDRVPIAIGATRDEAMQRGLPRGLRMVGQIGVRAASLSSFVTVAQPQLSPDAFAQVGKVCDDVFAENR